MRACAKRIYVCMRPSESADHLQPVADIPCAQNVALRRSLYVGRKMAITQSSFRAVRYVWYIQSYQLSFFDRTSICHNYTFSLFITLEIKIPQFC